jgi:glycosyltransferase involved in cell wall biosynthesis
MVTVIIPAYDAEYTIRNTIYSVFKQSYAGCFELIVVDDGSKDNTLKIINDVIGSAPKHVDCKVIESRNKGVSSARNTAINMASFSWIAFLDADDIWHPDKLERQLGIIEQNSEISFLGCNVDESWNPWSIARKSDLFSLNAHQIMIKWYPHTPTVVVRRQLIIDVGMFDDCKRYGEDCDLWLRLLTVTELWIYDASLVSIGQGKAEFGDKGLSSNLRAMHDSELDNIYRAFNRGQVNRFFYKLVRCWIGIKYFRRVVLVFIRRFRRF